MEETMSFHYELINKHIKDGQKLVQDIKDDKMVKHILPNDSKDYTLEYELEDTISFIKFCESEAFYILQDIEVEY